MNRKGKKGEYKDKKFGFGGRKKRSKYNTAESYADAFKNPEKKGKGSKGPIKGSKGPSKAPFKAPFKAPSKAPSKGATGFRKNAAKKFANKNKPKRKSK